MNRKSIRPRSKKRAAQEREYNTITRPEYLEDHPECEAKIKGHCTGMATTIHHKKGREGVLLNDTTYFLACCMGCHTYIENHPTEAKDKGWSISRLAK